MTFFAILSAFAAWFGADAAAVEAQAVRRVVVQDTLIIKVPVRPIPRGHVEWVERKGPKCVPADSVAGALLAKPDAIDFVLADRSRVRAIMDRDCPAIDFYGGFYVEPRDERLCARRDEIRSRVGGSCRISRFKYLSPKPRD